MGLSIDAGTSTALVAAIAAIASIAGALISSAATRSNQRDIAGFKSDLATRKSEPDARRDYEYEALKRLYQECGPLIFQLRELAGTALDSIYELARSARKGHDYSVYTTYTLLAPLALFKMMQRRLTSIDLSVAPRIRIYYDVVKAAFNTFADDELARSTPSLLPGRLDSAVEILIVHDAAGRERVMSFGEFDNAYKKQDSPELRGAMEIFDDIFRGFDPQRRPALWRLIVAQAYLYRALAFAESDQLAERAVAPATENERARLAIVESDEPPAADAEPFAAVESYLQKLRFHGEPPPGAHDRTDPPSTPRPANSAAEELLRFYRDQFAKGVATTTLAILGVTATLFALFVNEIAPMAGTVAEVITAQWTVRAATEELVRAQQRLESFDPKRPKSERKLAELRVKYEDANRKTKLSAVKIARTRLKELKTPLGSLNLPDDAGPFVWSMTLAGFLVYLQRRRLILTAMALRIVHLHRDVLHKPIDMLSGFGAWTPFWLAPLPSVEGEAASAEEEGLLHGLLRFLGWRSNAARRTRLVVVCAVALAVVWLCVLLVAIAYGRLAGGTLSFWGNWNLLALPLVVVLAIYSPWGRSVLPIEGFPERIDRDRDEATRRHFLQAAGVVSLSVLAYNAYHAIPRSLRYLAGMRSPRYRKKRKKKPLAVRNAIVVNPKTRVINYIRSDGLALGGFSLAAAEPVRLADIVAVVRAPHENGSMRLSVSHGPLIVEMVAVRLAKRGAIHDAAQLVLDYLKEHDFTPRRLFDLLAALLVHERSTAQLTELKAMLSPPPPRRLEREGVVLNSPDSSRIALEQKLFARMKGKAAARHWKNGVFVWEVPVRRNPVPINAKATKITAAAASEVF